MSKDVQLLAQEVSRLSRVVSTIEANYSRRIAQLEAKIEFLSQAMPTMSAVEMVDSMEAVTKDFEELGG